MNKEQAKKRGISQTEHRMACHIKRRFRPPGLPTFNYEAALWIVDQARLAAEARVKQLGLSKRQLQHGDRDFIDFWLNEAEALASRQAGGQHEP